MKTPSKNLEVISGFHSVNEAIKAGRRLFHCLYVLSDKSLALRTQTVAERAEKMGIRIELVSKEILLSLSGTDRHQGLAAKVSPFFCEKAESIFKNMPFGEQSSFILVIEQLEDVQNLGALIRTAVCAGIDAIMIPKDRAVGPNPAVSRISAGAMEHARVYLITNTASLLREFKKKGFWIAGLDAEGATSLFKADLTGDLVLVVGGEHKGLRPVVKRECDFILSIPMAGEISSLNASVAGGVAMMEAFRQRTINPLVSS